MRRGPLTCVRLAPQVELALICTHIIEYEGKPLSPQAFFSRIIRRMGLPALPADTVDEDGDDALLQQFYTAAMANGTTGDSSLDVLLQKGLYGNKLPKELKGQKAADAFQSAFDLIGGVPRLALWADKNPTAFFSLYSKLIPSSVKADVHATIKVDAPWMNPNRLAYMQRAEIIDTPPKED